MTTVTIGILMGSNSDWDTMQHAAQVLDQFGSHLNPIVTGKQIGRAHV